MAAQLFMFTSATIIFLLGIIHLLYTFSGPKLNPRDPALQESMRAVSPVISKETTMWKAWLGFNFSHSLGAMLFGAIYAYLALRHSELLFASGYLLTVGALMLGSFVVLGKKYWFSIPFRGISLAFFCYCIAILLHYL